MAGETAYPTKALHDHELMVGAVDAHGGIQLIHQTRSELRNERYDRINALLQMLFGKHQAVQGPCIASSLLVPRHDLRRRLARDLAHLIFDLAPVRREGRGKRDVELV